EEESWHERLGERFRATAATGLACVGATTDRGNWGDHLRPRPANGRPDNGAVGHWLQTEGLRPGGRAGTWFLAYRPEQRGDLAHSVGRPPGGADVPLHALPRRVPTHCGEAAYHRAGSRGPGLQRRLAGGEH